MLPKGSKQWWRLNRELLQKSVGSQGVPPLKAVDGTWSLTASDKANLLAHAFQAKCELPDPVPDARPIDGTLG
jgi:hypothetical protein